MAARQKQRKPKKPRNKAYDPDKLLRMAVSIEMRNARARAEHDAAERAKQMAALMGVDMATDQIQDIGLAFHLSFKALKDEKGAGTQNDLDAVTCSLNIGMVLCEMGHGKEYESAMVAGLDGCWRSLLRGRKTGRWGLDGDAIRAIEHALEVHEAQLEVASQGEVLQAIEEVHRRLAEGDVYREAA